MKVKKERKKRKRIERKKKGLQTFKEIDKAFHSVYRLAIYSVFDKTAIKIPLRYYHRARKMMMIVAPRGNTATITNGKAAVMAIVSAPSLAIAVIKRGSD